jgi:putative phosphoribosyl transferase
MRFHDRADAARQLAERLATVCRGESCIVYALPRGGVVPGAEVARQLGAPLDLVITRKVGHPDNPDYTIAAVTEVGDPVINYWAVTGVPEQWFYRKLTAARLEARRYRERYLGGRGLSAATGKLAIVVDDGIVTGLEMVAALRELQRQRPKRLVVMAPIISQDVVARLRQEADQVIALAISEHFEPDIASYYDSFPPVTDDEIVRTLAIQQALRTETHF